MRALAWTLVTFLLAGCVTTETGGMPKARSTDERMKAHLDLARGYLEKRDIQKARRPLEQALEIEPNSAEANTLMATIYQVEGEKDLAEGAYKRALHTAPDMAMARFNYGTFLYGEGRYQDARKNLLVAVKDTSYPARPQAYETLGLTEIKLGSMDEAEKALQRALMLDSNQPRALLELADLYFNRGNNAAARQYYETFLRVGKQNSRSLWLGIRLSRAFDDKNAISSYALALKNLYPGSEEYRLYQESIQ